MGHWWHPKKKRIEKNRSEKYIWYKYGNYRYRLCHLIEKREIAFYDMRGVAVTQKFIKENFQFPVIVCRHTVPSTSYEQKKLTSNLFIYISISTSIFNWLPLNRTRVIIISPALLVAPGLNARREKMKIKMN